MLAQIFNVSFLLLHTGVCEDLLEYSQAVSCGWKSDGYWFEVSDLYRHTVVDAGSAGCYR